MRTARNITIDFAFRISHFILLNTLCFVVHAVMSELCSFLCVYFYTDVGASVFFPLSLSSWFICSSCSIAIISHTKRIKKEKRESDLVVIVQKSMANVGGRVLGV